MIFDYVTAQCRQCRWTKDGDQREVVAAAHAHTKEPGPGRQHVVDLDCTISYTLPKDAEEIPR